MAEATVVSAGRVGQNLLRERVELPHPALQLMNFSLGLEVQAERHGR
jgi:hypothetical protein